MGNQKMPLTGVKILDMATVLAAPFAATLCGDMGADVVKLELPQGNDALRGLAPVIQGQSVFWKTANRGKRGISLDVRKPQGRELFLKLIKDFDVLIENFRTGTLDGWGLDIETMHHHNPKLIVLRLTGFGQTGPSSKRPGFARIFEAMGGFVNLCGEANGPPQHMNYPLGDAVAGLWGAFAICAALTEKNATPLDQQRGLEIDLSATEALLRLLDPLAAEYHLTGVSRQRTGSCASYTAPSNVYRSADGIWITLVGSSDAIFKRLCFAMNRPDLATAPRFVRNMDRIQNHIEIDGIVSDWCASIEFATLATVLLSHEVPFSKVYSVADALEDPHFKDREAFIQMHDDKLGSFPVPAQVPRFVGRVSPGVPCVGPDTGQHNEEIFNALGLSTDELDRLRAEGVI